jgi:hypothetical protein
MNLALTVPTGRTIFDQQVAQSNSLNQRGESHPKLIRRVPDGLAAMRAELPGGCGKLAAFSSPRPAFLLNAWKCGLFFARKTGVTPAPESRM